MATNFMKHLQEHVFRAQGVHAAEEQARTLNEQAFTKT